MYEERFYRAVPKLNDLVCYEVKFKETDLWCCTKTDLRKIIEDRIFSYRHQLEGYIEHRPLFKESLGPLEDDPLAPPIARKMLSVSSQVGVGPMATVAGAIAEFVGQDISSVTDDYIIENGGDISLRTAKDRLILVYAKESPFSGKIGIQIKGRERAYGVCTSSGTVGHSLSFGKADAVCIVADSATLADGLATAIGNSVKSKHDIARAIETGKTFPNIIGILIIVGDNMGIWGDIEVVRV